MQPDDDSFRGQIEALDIAESFSRAHRFDANETDKHLPVEMLARMRQGMQPTVHRVQKRTKRRYTIETGTFTTQSRDIIAALVVTRIE